MRLRSSASTGFDSVGTAGLVGVAVEKGKEGWVVVVSDFDILMVI